MINAWRSLSEHDRLVHLCVAAGFWAEYIKDAEGNSQEVCGLLYEDGPCTVPNIASDPSRQYQMDPDVQFEIMAKRGWPEAVYHTHPGGRREPSTIDVETALPNMPMLIGWPHGGGVWVDGKQLLEVYMGSLTNDIVEVYEDEAGNWRWRRVAPNNQVISGSKESFEDKTAASKAARRANPDAFDQAPVGHEGGTPDLNAPTDAGTSPSGTTGAGPVADETTT